MYLWLSFQIRALCITRLLSERFNFFICFYLYLLDAQINSSPSINLRKFIIGNKKKDILTKEENPSIMD